MCGIAGFVDFNRTSSDEVLKAMTDVQKHRGPDGEGQHLLQTDSAQIGLGHRRLSIIDLTETGAQPMQYNNLHITFNGEIYNYQEIKSELSNLGHSFNGNSDTEMILHAYEQWGDQCLHKFIGMFAIVIYDEAINVMFIARDRAGVKPLNIYWKDGLFMYASELKSFHEHPNFQKKLNINAVAAYMQYGSVPTPHCIFEYCEKLKPGYCGTLDLNSRKYTTKQYWNVYDYYNMNKLDISYDEAKTHTENILTKAFDYRMVADVPVGVFLSGGYDSTTTTAILQANRSEKLKTYTIGVPDIGLNEAPYAKDIAEHLGTDHTEINCTEKEAIELIEDLPFYYDEPFADSSALPTTLVSKMARKEVTVALSADGGDEIFGGYNRYDYMLRYGKKLNALPSILRSSTVGLMNVIPSERIPVLKNKYNFHNRYEKLKGVLKDPSNENIMLSLSQQFTNQQMKEFMTASFYELPTAYTSNELISGNSPLAYMMAIDYQTYMLDDILQKVDRATMSQSLEGREPMLDQHIIEFAAQLPDSYKYNEGIKKRILRDIAHQYIPEHLLDRPKMGFAIPIGKWLKEDIVDLVEDYINQKDIEEQGLFNWEYIHKIKSGFYNGKMEYDSKIWYILMFQMWYKRWMA